MTVVADSALTLLKVACDNAYEKNPDSCSHAVWDVVRGLIDAKEPHRQANPMIDYLIANWREVTVDAGHELAKVGTVVIGGLKGTPNGHVIVMYPGDKVESGGYDYFYAKLKKTLKMRSHGKYPRCMSTSMGSWPGAKSKGDKTVWDPWANDAVFATVKFWTPKTT